MKLTLREVIAVLEEYDPSLRVTLGLGSPDSYRGYYDEIAFDPEANITVADMLKNAKHADGCTFGGWKGGEYWMDGSTPCNIAEYGISNGDADALTMVRLRQLLSAEVRS